MVAVTAEGKLQSDGETCWLVTSRSTAVDDLGTVMIARGEQMDDLLADLPRQVGGAHIHFGDCRIEGELTRVGQTYEFAVIYELALRLDDFEYVLGDRGLSGECNALVPPSELIGGGVKGEEAALYGTISINSDGVAIADANTREGTDKSVPCTLSQDALFDLDAHVPGDDQPVLPLKQLSAVVKGRVVRHENQSVELLPEVISMALTNRTILRYYVPSDPEFKH